MDSESSKKAFDDFLQGGAVAALRSSTTSSPQYVPGCQHILPAPLSSSEPTVPQRALTSSPRFYPKQGVPPRIRVSTEKSHQRLIHDLYEWLCRRPKQARHIGTTLSDDGGATFAEFYAEFPQHAAKRKCKGSGIKNVIEAHGSPLLQWIDSGNCGMGRIQVNLHPEDHHHLKHVPIMVPPQRRNSFSTNSNTEDQFAGLSIDFSGQPRPLEPLTPPPAYLHHPSQRSPQNNAQVEQARANPIPLRGIGQVLQQRNPIQVREDVPSINEMQNTRHCKFTKFSGLSDNYAHTISQIEPSSREFQRRDHDFSRQTNFYRRTFSSTSLPNQSTSLQASQHPQYDRRSYQRRLEIEVAKVAQEAGIEAAWVARLVSHELDRRALSLCEDHDFDKLGLPLGTRIKLRCWAEKERSAVVTPATQSFTASSDW
eukprot:CAMPEP_0197301230 /NCGR_PEP_ID=MMETSP0890-20130614/50190_1 /TAXON_ID=44058 ORGANISM="Aureoumbra lagunensis, Strain CCMP1510" /NCGR_SAMPLE_ID=MMETSP0890 /ASSEMBLY_ACC=CAM_ASM_000533 /LENGTH=425 /DNA_ID=CAMNT_0042780481 /DNA_START=58 /DNA_END=1332 /DNA_ORIENTATION=+